MSSALSAGDPVDKAKVAEGRHLRSDDVTMFQLPSCGEETRAIATHCAPFATTPPVPG